MIIAVSMRTVIDSRYNEARDAISHDWIRYLDTMSVTPVLIPNALHDPSGYLRAIQARGLILTGGDDLGPLEGEPAYDGDVTTRDRTENALLSYAVDHKMPVLGVCRGLQLINVHFGGGLTRDVSAVGRHVNVTHPVKLTAAPPIRGLELSEAITNSYHGQGVLLGQLAPELKAFAVCLGGTIEGLYHPCRDVTAIQWHPERWNPARQLDTAIFREWLAQCE